MSPTTACALLCATVLPDLSKWKVLYMSRSEKLTVIASWRDSTAPSTILGDKPHSAYFSAASASATDKAEAPMARRR